MSWDKNRPDGDEKVNASDDKLRENAAAIEDALGKEHRFVTGGLQTGYHNFFIGTVAERNLIVNPTDGMIVFITDLLAGAIVQQIRSSSTWVSINVFDANLPRTNLGNVYTKAQWGQWESIAPSGGALPVDFSKSPRQYATISANTLIANPTNVVAGSGSDLVIDITIGGAGGWAITFDTGYRVPDGLRPLIATATGAKTRLYISGLQTAGQFLVTSVPNIGVIV